MIVQAWKTGSFSRSQLAERFNVDESFVRRLVKDQPRSPLGQGRSATLNVVREFYNVLPTELLASFSRHVVELTGERAELLNVVGSGSRFRENQARIGPKPTPASDPKSLYPHRNEMAGGIVLKGPPPDRTPRTT